MSVRVSVRAAHLGQPARAQLHEGGHRGPGRFHDAREVEAVDFRSAEGEQGGVLAAGRFLVDRVERARAHPHQPLALTRRRRPRQPAERGLASVPPVEDGAARIEDSWSGAPGGASHARVRQIKHTVATQAAMATMASGVGVGEDIDQTEGYRLPGAKLASRWKQKAARRLSCPLYLLGGRRGDRREGSGRRSASGVGRE